MRQQPNVIWFHYEIVYNVDFKMSIIEYLLLKQIKSVSVFNPKNAFNCLSLIIYKNSFHWKKKSFFGMQNFPRNCLNTSFASSNNIRLMHNEAGIVKQLTTGSTWMKISALMYMNAIFGLKLTISYDLCARLAINNVFGPVPPYNEADNIVMIRIIGGRVVAQFRCVHAVSTISSAGGKKDTVFFLFCSIKLFLLLEVKEAMNMTFEYWPPISQAWSNVVRILFSPFRAIKEITRELNKYKKTWYT